MKTCKRILSVVLALMMVLSVAMPIAANAAEESSATVLLSDDFSGDLSKWNVSNAQIVDGRVEISANGFIQYAADWTDYVLEFDADFNGQPYRGISFRRQEATGDDYFWWFGDGNTNIKVVKRTDAGTTWTDLSDVKPAQSLTGTHHFKLVVQGATIKTYVDGTLYNVGSCEDFLSGGILFFVAADVAYFDNVTVTTIPEESDVLLSDDFSGDLSQWNVNGAQIVDGRVEIGANGFIQYAADWTNYTLEFDADFNGQPYRGISFRRQEATGEDYFWWFGDGNTNIKVVKRLSSGEWVDLSDVKPAESLSGTHHFKLEVNGANIKTYVDGTLYNTAYGDEFTTGGILFFVAADVAYFDNVTVTAIEEQTESTAPEGALLYDDFSGDMSKWNSELAAITDGEQLQLGTVGGGMLTAIATPAVGSDWTNYTLEFDADFNGQPYRGISFRRQEATGDDYFWWFGDGNTNIKVVKRVSGVWTDISDVQPSVSLSGMHHFKLEVNGPEIKTYIDGTLYNTGYDEAFTTGGILLYVNYDAAWFDNVVVMPIETACEHANTTTTTVDASCTAAGSTTVTCDDCDEVISTTEIPALGHSYVDGICSVCGEADPDYVAPAPEQFDLSGMTMTLGNSLSANFVIDSSKLTGDGHYAKVTQTLIDGSTRITTIEQSTWTVYDGTLMNMTYSGVAAKEMMDNMTVVVYNAEGQQVTVEYNRTIEDYCIGMLGRTANAEEKTLFVDMLNYGAAAQVEFGYNTENLANARLTAEQQALATQTVTMEDVREKGTGYAGSTLTLESNILLNFVYQNTTIDNAAYAVVTFTDHYGNPKTETIEASDFVAYNSTLTMVPVTGMAVADCGQAVTCELYDAEGNVLSTSVDSVESYIYRMQNESELYIPTMKFATSSYNYFH